MRGALTFRNPGFTGGSTIPIGTIYDKTSWTDLSDFTASAGFSVSSNKILTPTDGTYSKKLSINVGNHINTGLNEFEIVANITMIASGSTDYGATIRLISSNNTVNNSLQFYVSNETTTRGKVVIYDEYSGNSYLSTETFTAYGVDSTYELSIRKTKDKYILTAKHGAETIILERNILYTSASGDMSNNTCKVGIGASTGQYRINSFLFKSVSLKYNNIAVGDSITNGFNVGTGNEALRWGRQINCQIDAGPGDKTREILLRVPEIIAMRPPKVFLMSGTNNSNDATFQTEHQSIVSQWEAANIKVVVLTPPARVGTNMSGYRDWIAATYPTKYIDIFAATKASGSNDLDSAYNTDGTHLNAAGNTQIANTIKAHALYTS